MPRKKNQVIKSRKLNKTIRTVAKSVINKQAELKYHDDSNASAPDWSGYLQCASLIPAGSSDTTRVGDQLFMTSMDVRQNVVLGDSTNMLRIIYFIWKLESTPVAGDILASTLLNTVDAPLSHYHKDGRTNFVVLSDRTYTLSGNRTIMTSHFTRKLNKNLYLNGGGTSGKNHVWMLTISDSSAVTHPSLVSNCRIRFRDL